MKYISLITLVILAYFKKISQTFVISHTYKIKFSKNTQYLFWELGSVLTSWSQILAWCSSGELKFLMEIR